MAAVGDLGGARDGARGRGEQPRHLDGRLDVELVVVGVVAGQLGERLVVTDPDEDPMGLDVVSLVKVAVVGGDERGPGGRGDRGQPLPGHRLVGQAVVLDLEEVVVPAQDLAVLLGRSRRARGVSVEHPGRRLAGQARRESDQAVRAFSK